MAGQAELVELKRAVEEMNRKMDEQTALLQGLIGILTSVMSNPGLGLNADKARIEETPQAYHPPTAGVKPRSEVTLSHMLRDLVEFHDARKRSKEGTGSLPKTRAKRQDVHKGKKVSCHVEASSVSARGSLGTAVNPQSSGKIPPRFLSRFSAPLSMVYERLLEAGLIQPLPPTPPPQKLSSSHNPDAYCTFHQCAGHSTNSCFHLRHKIQDLIDDGIMSRPRFST